MEVRVYILACICLCAHYTLAHQPHLVHSDAVTIQNPEVSQAFYATQPACYTIDSQNPFTLYVQILRPKIKDLDKNIKVNIVHNNTIIATVDGSTANWTVFHEPFSNDDYYQGPSLTIPMQGLCHIAVQGSEKYVLVVGQKEKWPLPIIIKTLYTLPRLKLYFEKSPILAYWNLSGVFLLAVLLTAAATCYLGSKLIKKLIGSINKQLS